MTMQATPVDARLGKRCRLRRWFWSLPGIRRSVFYQLTLLTLMALALPLAVTAVLIGALQPTASITVAALLIVLLLGISLMLSGLHCLLAPIDGVRRMLHHYRSDGVPRPLGYFLFDEMGKLAAEAMQTLRETNARLNQTAQRDTVTDTFNHHGLKQELSWLLDRSNGHGEVTVAAFRLHDFRQWQLGLGADALHGIARVLVGRLRGHCRWDDALAALGQGRFAVALAARPEAEIETRVGRLRTAMNQPIVSDGHRLRTRYDLVVVRAGRTATAQTVLDTVETALEELREADTSEAFITAGRAGHGTQRRCQLAMDLDRALDEGELFAEFQPCVDLATGTWTGAESLVRWQHPEHGTIPPGDFIPLAERHGRIARLGDYMLDSAVTVGREWLDDELNLRVAVNIGAEQVERRTLAGDVAAVLQRHRLLPDQLELELTESSLLMNLEGAIDQLAECREMGVGIALDDFGSGYSSLAYLARLPITRLKIDRSFIAELDHARGRAIVQAIIDLARGFGLATTAEGIGTREQARVLAAMGCGEGQGFLFARPMPPDAIRARASTSRKTAESACT